VKVLWWVGGSGSMRSSGRSHAVRASVSCTRRREARESPSWRAATRCVRRSRLAVPPCRELGVDLVVVGPEAPSSADSRTSCVTAAFPSRPRRPGAQIEGSKTFAKDVMEAAGVPTARTLAVARPPCVVKADGLAAGKGVWVCRPDGARCRPARSGGARAALPRRGAPRGEEVSIFARATDAGAAAARRPGLKRIGDNDEGANTGGMGSYSPVPGLDRRRGR